MEITTASKRMPSLIELYDLHTALFVNVTEGISDEDAQNRLNTKANHIAWIAGSLVQERYEMAKLLADDPDSFQDKQSADELFKDHKGIQDSVTYPSLAEFRKDWEKISPVLRATLLKVTEEKLNLPFDMDGMSMTNFDLVIFLTHREPYFIGQVGLYRRLMGYEAMKYPM